jgi:hypothetical protein
MWSSLKSFWRGAHYQWLAVALIVSAFLHLLFLGELSFNLPDLSTKPNLIKVQLVLAPAVGPTKTVKPVAVRPSPKKLVLPKASPTIPLSPTSDLPALADSVLPATSAIDAISTVAAEAEPQAIEPPLAAAEPLQISTNAYHYVHTTYDVHTDINAQFDSSPVGKAAMIYDQSADGERYHLESLMQARGLVALFIPDLVQTSDGKLTAGGLQPLHYLYQFGNKKNKTFSADFDWQAKTLSLHSASEVQTLALVEGAQDLLSFMYQFMFVPPLQNMQLAITNGKKLGIYDYSFEGEETIPTKMGKLSSIHLMRQTEEGDEKTELWLAIDYQYVPVKIRKTEKKGKVYELLVTSLKTEKPATP